MRRERPHRKVIIGAVSCEARTMSSQLRADLISFRFTFYCGLSSEQRVMGEYTTSQDILSILISSYGPREQAAVNLTKNPRHLKLTEG